MTLPINISLFAHIELDSELSGRFGVQGNTFDNTFSYLNQYFKTLPPDKYSEVQDLAESMDNLITKEKWIKHWIRNDVAEVQMLSERIGQELSDFPINKKYLIPGGWQGINSPGHAMIYQFEKMADGGIAFAIYNAGAGIEHHEKTSSAAKELFSPVKMYAFPPPVDPVELKQLIKRLIVPQLNASHPARNKREFDAKTLYRDIDLSLAFLNASPIPQDLSKPHVSTAGQLSGTCTQRSIHQMLKVTMGDLSTYQRLIFDFKLYALNDFINTHPASIRSTKITAFIQKAIINNLRILQEKDIFKTPTEKKNAINQLKVLQQTLTAETLKTAPPAAIKETIATPDSTETTSFIYPFTTTIVPFETASTKATTSSPQPPRHMPLNSGTLLTDLDALIQTCLEQQAGNPLWVMDQIEQVLMKLPIPESSQKEKPYYATIAFYNGVTTQDHFEKMAASLDALQDLYMKASSSVIKVGTVPSQYATEFSLMVLRDYFDVTGESVTGKPSFHPHFYSKMAKTLTHLVQTPFLATNHPAFDYRIKQLLNGFSENERKLDSNETDYYISFLDTSPPLKQYLMEQYNLKHAADNSKFHQSLRKGKLTELYMLFEQFDVNGQLIKDSTLHDNSAFAPAIKQITQQHALILFLIKGHYLLSGKDERLDTNSFFHTNKKILAITNYAYSDPCTQNFCHNGIDIGHISREKSLPFNKYNLPDSSSSNALLQGYHAFHSAEDETYSLSERLWFKTYQNPDFGTMRMFSRLHLNANQVQLAPHSAIVQDHLIDKEDYFDRDLFHLRLVPEQQIKLTLDYFGKSEVIGRLDDPSVQLYVEANLFEPSLLWAALNDDPTFLSRIDGFINKGLGHFADANNLLNQSSIFFIRLRILLHNYVMLAEQNVEGRGELLQTDCTWLSKLIEQQTDPTILASLHTYRFFNLMTQHQLQPQQTDIAPLSHALMSYFHMQTQYNPHDNASAFEQERAALEIKAWLQQMPPETIHSFIRPLIKHLLPELEDNGLTINSALYPVYQVIDNKTNHSYTVNLEQGRIFHNGCALGPIPLFLKTHPILRRLGLEQVSTCLVAENEQSYLFAQDYPIRIKKDKHRWIVQKEWKLGEWYQLTALTDIQQKQFALDSTSIKDPNLPAILSDDSIEAWVGEKGTLIVQNHQPIYQVDEQGRFHALDKQGNQTDLVLTTLPEKYKHQLMQFEDPGFFRVNLDPATSEKGNVDFARYGFSLAISDGKITLPGTDYTLLSPEDSVFSKEIASLQWSNGTDQQCTVAVQPFYFATQGTQTEGDYYQLTHDIKCEVPKKCLKQSRNNKKIISAPLPWNYHHSAHAITYKVVNGEPQPNTPAEALYLCYLYLATHEIDKAWTLLETINQRFSLTGSAEELTYLSWIVQGLPMILDKKQDEEVKHETPDYVACKLKALALYTDFLTLNDSVNFSTHPSFDTTRDNGYYDELCYRELTTFRNFLPLTIHQLYSRHQQGARHQEEKYTLNDAEALSLLNYCAPKSVDKDGRPFALGALAYERRRLSLKLLLKDYQRLGAIAVVLKQAKKPIPLDLTKRLEDIKQQITVESRIAKRRTKLAKAPINLSLSFFMNERLLSDKATRTINSWDDRGLTVTSKATDALRLLSSGIEQDDFITHFPTYLEIARIGTAEQQAVLKQFCIAYLIGSRHLDLSKQDTNIPGLTNILYRVLENPNQYPTDSPLTLSKLTRVAFDWDIPPIEVLQAQDVYDAILSDNQSIWDELQAETHAHSAMPSLQSIHSQSLVYLLGIDDVCKSYRLQEINYQKQLQTLMTSMVGERDPHRLQQAEEEAGQLKFKCTQMQRQLAEETLQSADIRAHLNQGVNKLHDTQEPILKKQWAKIIELANKPIEDTDTQQHLELLASQRHELTQKEIIRLYLHADRALYIEKTGLSAKECDQLHQLIHENMALELRQQQLSRLLTALNQAGDTPKPSHLHQIANVLMSENVGSAQTDPGLMLFQYAENILVHPRQAQALSSLLSTPNNAIEKVIMGGGKSKVILPVLAQKKATGLNLVVVEVPRALLATNHADLSSTSQRLFGQKAHRFEFNRDSDCSPERLETIYKTFSNIMTNREYLVTTGESMQSLELKYLELLLERPEDPKAQKKWEQQIHWASKITTLIKQQGDAVIDEVHQGLLLKKKLNYTLGVPHAIDANLIQHSIDLYQFAQQLGRAPTAEDLLFKPNSPLKSYITLLNPQSSQNISKQFLAYFNNKAMPMFIEQASPEIKEGLAFYKEQLTLFPQTQSRHYKEHYGPSEKQSSALKRTLAIPYAASNRPNERSRFGNTLETINYTIQSLLIDGLNKELLQLALEKWLSAARSEHFSAQYATLNDTPTAKRINQLLKGTGFTLQMINLRQEGQLTKLLEKLKGNQSILYTLLKEHILPQIPIEPALLHSDVYAHVDMYHTVQGISGTPWNHTTYHQRLTYNPQTSIGTDGYIQTVLKNKSTSVTPIAFETPIKFLTQIFEGRHNVRAIIDISAQFAGISNLTIATQLATCALGQNLPKPLRYILYFNTEEVLCAIDVKSPDKPITLATSDPLQIDQILGCTPDERMTYYDQSHTVGTDIKQAATGHAIVLADDKTHLQSFLQGCMRMRGLAEQQTVSVIVPMESTFDDLILRMATNEQEQISEDNFFATLAKMNNLIRNDVLQRLADIPETDFEKKYKLAQIVQHYFIETKLDTLFAQYGSINVLQNTALLFQDHAHALINNWTLCLGKFNEQWPKLSEKDTLTMNLSEMITQSLPLCKAESIRRSTVVSQETEQQQEALKEMLSEQDMLQEAQSFSSRLVPKIRPNDASMLVLESFLKTGSATSMQTLNTACRPPASPMENYFSDQLLVSDNYAQVYDDQKHMLGPYLKPAMAILFRKDGEHITACLIDMEDVAELQKNIPATQEEPKLWISTAGHACLAGSLPANLLDNKHYQSLIEQIKFFNGDCLTLSEQKKPLHWLSTETSAKLNYFERYIMPYRQTIASEVISLRATLTKKSNQIIPNYGRSTHPFFSKKPSDEDGLQPTNTSFPKV